MPEEEIKPISVTEKKEVVVEVVKMEEEKKDTIISGFLLGAKLGSDFPLTREIDISSCGGFGLYLGWRFPNNIGLQMSYFVTTDDVEHIPVSLPHRAQMGFGGFILDLKYHFLPGKTFKPYPLIGVGSYVLVDVEQNGLSGLGLNLGGGFDYFLNEHFSIGPEIILYPFSYSVLATKGNYSQMDEGINGTTLSLFISATYQF